MTEPMGERGRQGAAPLGGHTPGPWNLFAPIHSDGHWFVGWNDEYGGHIVADRCSKADARLIAAAPDLLEALEEISAGAWPGFNDDDSYGPAAIAQAAIAKARGEQ